MNTKINHIYIGNVDRLPQWAGISTYEDVEDGKFAKDGLQKAVGKVRELIKNYLQLDSVNFLFGTGTSIHLGAASIQNIPKQAEEDIANSDDIELKEDFKKYIMKLQKSSKDANKVEDNTVFKDERDWDVIYDGTYIRDYKKVEVKEGEEDAPEMHYGEICVKFELLLNYLTAISYQKNAENDNDGFDRVHKLINSLKASLFNICDVHERETSQRDWERIDKKGFKDAFTTDKYIFHEKFLKSLMQRPLNLQRANVFTSNYDLAFEYAFDNLGIKYIDGFSGFHHRYFKPETFNYDIFYPGSTTAGKVQRIEKVVRYFKLHGSISWVADKNHSSNNLYGIEEMPIDLIKRKAKDGGDFNFGNLMVYPTAVKKSYTLDLPYSELFRHFAYCTSQPQSVLFTVGYSFCDEHFNDIIYQALSNPSFTLIIVDFYGTRGSEEIKRLKELNDPRIIILEGDFFGDFLTLADTLMPDFLDTSSSDSVADTLNALLSKAD